MKQKKIIAILFAVSLLFVSTIFIRIPVRNFLCTENTVEYRGCVEMTHFFDPIAIAFSTPFIITLILFFLRREAFIAWAKFAVVAFPLMLGILLFTFNNTPVTGDWISGPTDDQLASILLPSLFLIISLLIIGIKSWKLRGE